MTRPENPEPSDESSPAGVSVPARITLFGFDDVPADAANRDAKRGVESAARGDSTSRGLIAAPLAALVPPHAPWALGALGIALLTARRRWAEEHTLHFLEGACPRCGEGITLSRPARLRHPHATSCPSCQYELAISVDL